MGQRVPRSRGDLTLAWRSAASAPAASIMDVDINGKVLARHSEVCFDVFAQQQVGHGGIRVVVICCLGLGSNAITCGGQDQCRQERGLPPTRHMGQLSAQRWSVFYDEVSQANRNENNKGCVKNLCDELHRLRALIMKCRSQKVQRGLAAGTESSCGSTKAKLGPRNLLKHVVQALQVDAALKGPQCAIYAVTRASSKESSASAASFVVNVRKTAVSSWVAAHLKVCTY